MELAFRYTEHPCRVLSPPLYLVQGVPVQPPDCLSVTLSGAVNLGITETLLHVAGGA
jgi:hypothetical protein